MFKIKIENICQFILKQATVCLPQRKHGHAEWNYSLKINFLSLFSFSLCKICPLCATVVHNAYYTTFP